MLHLHFGVTTTDIDHVVTALFDVNHILELKGDGWNTWGEQLGDARNDDMTMHAVVQIPDVERARTLASILKKTRLNLDGDFFVLTEENWEKVVPLDLELLLIPDGVRAAIEHLYNSAIEDATNTNYLRDTRNAFATVIKALADGRRI